MIDSVFFILTAITVLFAVFLFLRTVLNWKICSLCAAVASVWIGLLAGYWMGNFSNLVLAAPLLGASVVGVYYLIEKKTEERLYIFRLPFFLSLLLAVYLLLGEVSQIIDILLVGFLWGIAVIIYIYRENPKVKKIADRIIACCKNW